MTNLDDERISKFQRQIYDWLRELYPSFSIELEKHIPKTNQRIDIYVENLTLAVECDGIQHFKPVGFYVKTIEQWDKMIESDKIKNKVLEEAGVTVLRIPYNHKLKSSEDLKTLINSLKFNTKNYNSEIFVNKYKEEQKSKLKIYHKNSYKEFKEKNKETIKQKSKDFYKQAKEWKKQNDRSKQ